MCYHTEHKATAKQLKDQYKAEFPEEEKFETKDFVNGFDHPLCPIITRQNRDEIQLFHWGLLPHWARDLQIQNKTLNAKIETIHERPSFKDYFDQRCLIPVTGLYEWEPKVKGKGKDRYLIKVENKPIFSLAGLWNSCLNPETGILIQTFTAVTNDGFVAILDNEEAWLAEGELSINSNTIWTQNPTTIQLPPSSQLDLFN